ncbi:hypothetical protein HY250_00145 [Candidatus Azambacteria bacterium]|nr:hypothetical protein [Candidatus Azambacteria bacterium]
MAEQRKQLVMDEKELIAVAKVLLNECAKGAQKGEYVSFPPNRIEIHRGRKIRFEAKNGVPDLRESFRRLGVTLYHLASGESEYCKESFRIDGYAQKPLQTKLWPVMSLLLSGNACSIVQVEREFNEATSWAKEAQKSMRRAVSQIGGAIGRAVGAFWRQGSRMLRFLAPWIQRNQNRIETARDFTLLIGCLAEIVWYWIFNWRISGAIGLFLSTLASVVVACFLMFGLRANSRRNLYWRTSACVIAVMVLYASLSFWIPLSVYEKNPVEDHAVLVDRKSGEFVARLPLKIGDHFLTWEKNTINHFRYRVVPGVPVDGSFPKTFTFIDGARRIALPVTVDYRMMKKKEDFISVWQAWKDKEQLDRGIDKALDAALGPKLNERFGQLNGKLNVKHSTADLLFDADLVAKQRVALEDALRFFLDAEARSVFPHFTLHINKPPEAVPAPPKK